LSQADAEGYNLIAEKAVSTGAAVLVKGELVESPGGNQAVELAATSVELIGACPSDYPLQKKVRALPVCLPNRSLCACLRQL